MANDPAPPQKDSITQQLYNWAALTLILGGFVADVASKDFALTWPYVCLVVLLRFGFAGLQELVKLRGGDRNGS